jgi:hypothetical protein
MKSNFLYAIAAMLVVALPASAARPIHTVTEDGHEIVATMLTLPSSASGTLSILGCTACQRQTMTLSADARFYVGKSEVTYATLKDMLATYPKSSVLVVTPVGKNVVTRIKLTAAVAADPR